MFLAIFNYPRVTPYRVSSTSLLQKNVCLGPVEGEGVLGLMFAGYVPLASQSPCPIIVYFLANYRPHSRHFLENVIFAIPTYASPYPECGFKRLNVMRSIRAYC